MSKAVHDAVYFSNLKGMRQVQNHSEKDLIMKTTELELQAFKDLDEYDTVSSKTILRRTWNHLLSHRVWQEIQNWSRNEAKCISEMESEDSVWWEQTEILWRHLLTYTVTTHDLTTSTMLYTRLGSETQRPWQCLLWFTIGMKITQAIRENTEWLTRQNRGQPFG